MSDEIVPIQVTVPGADPAADALLRVGAAAGKVGDAAGAAKPKVEGTDEALKKIAESSKASEKLLGEMHRAGSAGFQALAEKAGQFGKSIGGVAGDLAEVGIKSLAAFGTAGLIATGAIALIGMATTAIEASLTAERSAAAQAAELASLNDRLGGTYQSVAGAVDATKTAEQNLTAIRAAALAVMQQQLALTQAGFSPEASRRLSQAVDAVHAAQVAARGSALAWSSAQIQHALTAGNTAEQLEVLGVSFRHSTDAAQEQINIVNASTVAQAHAARDAAAAADRENAAAVTRRRAAMAAVAGLDAQTRASGVGQIAVREMVAAQAAALVTYQRMNLAHKAASELAEAEAAATRALAASVDVLTDAQKAEEYAFQRATEAKARRGTGAAGPTAAELRAQAEALRVAREANDNAGRAGEFTARQAVAVHALAFATNELRIAEEAARRGGTTTAERTALTAALSAQTQAQAALNAVGEAEAQAARGRIRAIEEESRVRADLAFQRETLDAAAATQMQRAADQARALDDARLAANAALAASRAAAANDNGGDSRAALLAAETAATDALRAAQTELWHANDEVNRSLVASVEQRQRLIAATNGVAQATERQTAAQRAVNAEAAKIRTDRTDALRDSAKGLAGGLVEAGIAAAIAGENIGAAAQKQLAAGLAALAAESAQRSLFSLGSALFQVGMGRLDLAGPLFVSAATFAAVAAGSGIAAAALTPSSPAASGGSGSGGSTAGNVSPPSQQGSGGGNVYYINYNAPVIGGRESTDAELGERMRRFDRAAGRR